MYIHTNNLSILIYNKYIYIYIYIHIDIHSMCMDIGVAIPFEENARLAITENYLPCTPNAPLI